MEDKRNIYFIGAGGIGMAALERYFLARGYNVAGYDRTPSELTDSLAAEGVTITFDESVDAIPEAFTDPATTLVVYTPAVPESMPQLAWFRRGGFEVVKRARLLGLVTRQSLSLCFAGTHGKTTTSTLAAHILNNCPCGCNAFLGGVSRNYDSNFILNAGSRFSVVEADEFDRSFHQLTPYIAVITSTDPDHLDIYGTEEAYLESFAHFTELLPSVGSLVLHEGLKLTPRPLAGVRTYTYSRDSGDFHAANIRRGNGTIIFDLILPADVADFYYEDSGIELTPDGEAVIRDIELGVPVEINIENAVASMAACLLTGEADVKAMREAVKTFMGAKRRFEFHLKEPGPEGRAIIDDYAHHPDELRASISSVKALYPDRELTVAFQPHLYTRTRDFAPQFAEALSLADRVILLDIYPARELPIEGVTSKIILDRVTATKKQLIDKQEFVETIKNTNFDILLTAGAGDINLYLPEIVKNAQKR